MGRGGPYGQQSSSSLAVDQGYGMVAAAAAGRRSPRDYNGGAYGPPPRNQGYYEDPRSRQGSVDSYGRNMGGGGRPQQPQGYENMNYREPRIPDMMAGGGGGYDDQPPRRSPAPRPSPDYGQAGGYNGPIRRSLAPVPRPSPRGRWAARPPPQRQYSSGPSPPSRSPSLQNNSGFDFNSGYSRPPTQGRDRDEYTNNSDYGRRPSAGSYQGSGAPVAPAAAPAAAYPGYKPYQPAENGRQHEGWSGV